MTDMQVTDVMTELEISDIKVVSADVINEALSNTDSHRILGGGRCQNH